ncbi:MAG: tetratricopeptide repeat protein, partial [Flavobacteriaceae bacterium]|nr:tetratricopeptide repeat protein [Flavobacteriaceae bacterium]
MIEMSLNQFDDNFTSASQSAHTNAANLAKYFLSKGKPSSALRLVLEVLKVNAKDVAALTLAGIACRELKDPAKALHLYSNALAQTGPDPILLGFKADALNLLRRYREAISAVQEANIIDETLPANHLHMGTALMELDKFDEAEACFKIALDLKSDYAPAMINLGLIAHNRLRFELALKYYDQVIDLGDANPNLDWNDVNLAKWNKSHILLSLGDYENGLPLFEARSLHGDIKSRPKKIPGRLWDGKASTVGKKILIHCEGGFGDTIQFVRYADYFEQGTEVKILCQRNLLRLMRYNFPLADVFAVGDELPEFDYHCPMMSLPMVFGTELTSIPKLQEHYTVDDTSLKACRA